MLRQLRWPAIAATALAAPLALSAQQSDLSVSPFVSFLPSASAASPLAGLALTLGGSGAFAIRGSANIALQNSNSGSVPTTSGIRPWGADADAMLFLGHNRGGYNRTLTPFVFVGIGTQTNDDFGFTQTNHNWSYGAGAALPVGSAIDLFGEGRWRMSQYVLPTAHYAPTPTTELRFGVSFHVGNSGQQDQQPRRRGRRISVHID